MADFILAINAAGRDAATPYPLVERLVRPMLRVVNRYRTPILRGIERGQIAADREDGESVLARLGLSLADTAGLLGLSTSGIAKAVARAERPYVH